VQLARAEPALVVVDRDDVGDPLPDDGLFLVRQV
jgi:hypothetical protein